MGSWHQSYEEFIASHRFETPTSQLRLMEAICERNNMKSADCALCAMPTTVSSLSEASGQGTE
jgi:hypothetical protein